MLIIVVFVVIIVKKPSKILRPLNIWRPFTTWRPWTCPYGKSGTDSRTNVIEFPGFQIHQFAKYHLLKWFLAVQPNNIYSPFLQCIYKCINLGLSISISFFYRFNFNPRMLTCFFFLKSICQKLLKIFTSINSQAEV